VVLAGIQGGVVTAQAASFPQDLARDLTEPHQGLP
jgi:hypothetical protein